MVPLKTDSLNKVEKRFNTVWSDFNITDEDVYNNEIFISEIFLSDHLKSIILNFSRYTGYDKKAYGIPVDIDRGITEQESYDIWLVELQRKNKNYNDLMRNIGINSISQCAYDGLFLYFWFTNKLTEVQALEGIYDMKEFIVKKDWDTVASMLVRCYEFKDEAIEAAKILRLAFYKRFKDRRWLRQQGIFKIREKNQLYKMNVFTEEELSRARFSYYAETKTFLPYTPEGIKRDINNRYGDTLDIRVYEWDGVTNQFEISRSPSLYPVEKIQVFVNGNLLQNYYDYIIDGTVITIRDTSDFTEKSQIKLVISI